MEAEIEAQLNTALDPPPDSPAPLPSTPLTPAPPSHPATPLINPASPSSPALASATKRKARVPKTKSVVPGSSADFRRREANRLAAERSRSRQHEKATGLVSASKVLQDENARLREQIAQLEEGSLLGSQHGQSTETNHTRDGPGHNVSAGPEGGPVQTVPPAESGKFPEQPDEIQGHAAEADHTTTQEQEAHSHTILAALTGMTGVDFSEGNEANWMQGMESFLKDSEASGRLDELATVATGKGDGTGAAPDSDPAIATDVASESTGSDNRVTAHPTGVTGDGPRLRAGGGPSQNAAVILAAAINTEMERLIMEDLADTKAAIVKVERQLAALRGEASHAQPSAATSTEAPDFDSSVHLPPSILSITSADLGSASMEMQTTISNLQADLPGLHQEVVRLREAKTAEENRVVELVRQVQDLVLGTDEKPNLVKEVKDVGGFVHTLLSDEHDQPDFSYASVTYSSPAIARRRRGRPPKGDISRTFYQSFLLSPSPAHASSSRAEPTSRPRDREAKEPKLKLARKPRKSRLSQQVHLPEREKKRVERDLRQLQAQAQAEDQDQEKNHGHDQAEPQSEPTADQRQSDILVEATPTPTQTQTTVAHQAEDGSAILGKDQTQIDSEATAEAVTRAEEFILSQLASHSQNQHQNQHEAHGHAHHHGGEREGEGEGEDDLRALGSTSFADFLPAQEELERQAGVDVHDHDHHFDLTNQTEAQAHALLSSQALDDLPVGHAPGTETQTESETDGVLARLRKGPPGSCDICMRTETTVWRKLVLGTQDLKVCNACGTYHHKFGVIRPPELWDDGKSIRRRRTGPRPSTQDGGESDSRPRKKARKGRKGIVHDAQTSDVQAHTQGQAEPDEQDPDDGAGQSQTQTQTQTHAESDTAEQGSGGVGVDIENVAFDLQRVLDGSRAQLQERDQDDETGEDHELSDEAGRAVLDVDVALIQELGAMQEAQG